MRCGRRQRRRRRRQMDDRACFMSDLGRGQRGRVVGINVTAPALRRRLFDMGITQGVEFEVKKISPLGDPVDIVVRGYELCLRKSCMDQIEVEVVE